MTGMYSIRKDDWAGWLEAPAPTAGWAASPVRIARVVPLKTGWGRLALEFIQPLSPGGGRRRRVELTVVQHELHHLVGSFRDEDGTARTAIVSSMSFDWLASYCPTFFERRPPYAAMVDGQTGWSITPAEHLDRVLGPSDNEVLCGATANGFSRTLPAMPARAATFTLDVTFPPLDSLLIARGSVPREMEEKWLVLLADGVLRFHRSWTGIFIYEVGATWCGDRLHLGSVRANREPDQYRETDDGHDAAMLRWVIDVVLRGISSIFPVRGDVPMQAWAVAGSASL
jgi:hypothetical protein